MSNSPISIEYRDAIELKPYDKNARTHSKKQIRQIADSITRFGFTNPILITDDAGVIAGHGRLEAARLLGISRVPTVKLSHLSEAERRAYILADNKLALNAGWDREILAIELQALVDLEFDVEITGFSLAEIDPFSPCGHQAGKVYAGRMCTRIIEKADIVSIALVLDPVQKYSVMIPDPDPHDYARVRYVVERVAGPFSNWAIRTTLAFHDHELFEGWPTNDNCPCHSGRKYQHCCRPKPGVLLPHDTIFFEDPIPEHLASFIVRVRESPHGEMRETHFGNPDRIRPIDDCNSHQSSVNGSSPSFTSPGASK